MKRASLLVMLVALGGCQAFMDQLVGPQVDTQKCDQLRTDISAQIDKSRNNGAPPATNISGRWRCVIPASDVGETWTISQTKNNLTVVGSDSFGGNFTASGAISGSTVVYKSSGDARGLMTVQGGAMNGSFVGADCATLDITCTRL